NPYAPGPPPAGEVRRTAQGRRPGPQQAPEDGRWADRAEPGVPRPPAEGRRGPCGENPRGDEGVVRQAQGRARGVHRQGGRVQPRVLGEGVVRGGEVRSRKHTLCKGCAYLVHTLNTSRTLSRKSRVPSATASFSPSTPGRTNSSASTFASTRRYIEYFGC